MAGLLVALGAGAAWAGLDATRKGLVGRIDPTAAAAWVNLVQGPLFVAWAVGAADVSVSASYWPIGIGALVSSV